MENNEAKSAGKFRKISEKNIADRELHRTFVKLGYDRRRLANQLLAILPEIFERMIWRKYARTIEGYAWRFGGLSESVVRKRLRLEKYVKDKPNLREAIATEGVHKVALVASLATVEDEAIWADKLKNMSKPAVQELSKEVRYKIEMGEICLDEGVNMNLFENCNGKNRDDDKDGIAVVGSNDNQSEVAICKTTLCSAAPQHIRIDLEGELFFFFLKLKKKYGENLTNREVMKRIFEENLGVGSEGDKDSKSGKEESLKVQINGKIKDNKGLKNNKNNEAQSVKVIPGDNFEPEKNQTINDKSNGAKNHKRPPSSRYISIHVRRNLLQKTAGKCSYPDCQRPAQIFHHTDRFANIHSHESLKPICKIHHEFAHNGLIQNEKEEAQDWQLQLQNGELEKIDRLYREYRKTAG